MSTVYFLNVLEFSLCSSVREHCIHQIPFLLHPGHGARLCFPASLGARCDRGPEFCYGKCAEVVYSLLLDLAPINLLWKSLSRVSRLGTEDPALFSEPLRAIGPPVEQGLGA